MELEEAKRELDGINIQAFLSASYEQNTYIVNKADKVTKAIETILQELDRLQKENEELGVGMIDSEDGFYVPLTKIQIKSIVTHQQFNSIKYEVE